MKKKPDPELKKLLPWLEKFSQAKILVIGDLMRDIFIWGKVKRISPEAPVPVVEVERETAMLGGAANVVNNLIALGTQIYLAGVVGDDEPGELLLKELLGKGVNLQAVVVESGRPTTVKTRIIAHSQQVVRFDREVKSPISEQSRNMILEAIKDFIKEIDVILISDYAKGVINSALTGELFPLAYKEKKPVIVDPKISNLNCYQGAEIITPNHFEVSQAVRFEVESNQEVEQAGKILLEELEVSAILITRGERGMSLIERNGTAKHIPAQAREVYDVTGAGDTVLSTLGASLAVGMDLYSACLLANLSAGIGVGKLGTSVVSREELEEALVNGF